MEAINCLVKLKIISNFNKNEYVNNFTYKNSKDLFYKISLFAKNLGYEKYVMLQTLDGKNQINENNVLNFIVDDMLEIKLNLIVYPNCAYEFARLNGLTFFFHTNETNHEHNPHIHVKTSDGEISICLKDFHIIGKFKNKKQERKAKTFVIDNFGKIMDEWNKIMKSL